jgi:hypothetical protein
VVAAHGVAVSQSYVIAGVLAFAFVFFVTAKGELPKYLKVLGL